MIVDQLRAKGEIVNRLRAEGESAFRRHLSFGMWQLCEEAADLIEFLAAKVERLEQERRR